ncbi:MAG: DUF4179 domain-containing protein [Clostridia bacterium]|nr:DUF4179 domain-containing protein [Clostridia bacterium]
MKEEKFDKILKKQMQEDNNIPDKINQLFLDFESEVNMKEYKEKNKIILLKNYLKTISIAASAIIVTFFGGCTYAHVNGRETIISPLLRNLGINSKYEQNATQFNDEVLKNQVKIKLLDGAMDKTTFILGYEIEIANNNPDNWIEINGEYKINNVSVKPINSTIDKISDIKYVYYQVFDTDELKLEDSKNVKINANINEIKQYTESENLDSAFAVYGNSFKDKWNFNKTIDVKNLEETKTFKFVEPINYEIIENVNTSVIEFITGSYTNILKIKTDKTNYNGNSFEKYYKILDEANKEIATFTEEERAYDYKEYNDRIISENINKNSKITIQVYLKMINSSNFKKVATIPVDLSKSEEVTENKLNLKQYKGKEYSFIYKEDWKLTPKLDTTKVGPNSIYLGALELEIPSTTNSANSSSIYVKTTAQNTTLDQYINQIRKENTSSPSEYYEEKDASEVNLKNQRGYQITTETTDGEELYVKQDIFTIVNNKAYRITFFGTQKEYNNLKQDINRFINNFEI